MSGAKPRLSLLLAAPPRSIVEANKFASPHRKLKEGKEL